MFNNYFEQVRKEFPRYFGSHTPSAKPAPLDTRVAATREYGEANGLEALTTGKLARATASLSEDLAAVTVELGGLAGIYHAPNKTRYIFFGLTDFQEVG
jgi:hypothetical protein